MAYVYLCVVIYALHFNVCRTQIVGRNFLSRAGFLPRLIGYPPPDEVGFLSATALKEVKCVLPIYWPKVPSFLRAPPYLLLQSVS